MFKLGKTLLNIFLVIVVLILALIWFRENDLFVINQIKVLGNNLLTQDEIVELADLDFTKEIFEVNTEIIKKRLLSNPLIKEVKVSRYLPSAIKIKIEEKDLLATISDRNVTVLDADGKIVNTDKLIARYDLPVITGAHLITDSLGFRYPSNNVNIMLTILKAIRLVNVQLYYDISEINYKSGYGVLLYLRQNAIPIVMGFNNYREKVKNLSLVYDHLNEKKQLLSIKSMDVRFDGQVVVRN